MSADFINGIGSRGPGAYGLGAPRTVGGSPAAAPTNKSGESPTTDAAVPAEGFSPTSEASETAQDAQAGEARASQIFAAWGATVAPPASAGQLQVQGAENTTVNQVHGVSNGQHVGAQGPDPGFSAATVYSSRPPTG